MIFRWAIGYLRTPTGTRKQLLTSCFAIFRNGQSKSWRKPRRKLPKWPNIFPAQIMNQTPAERPTAQEIEVSTFGPGFGESIVVHAGNNEWVIVDLCIDSAREDQPRWPILTE